jgi:hypothetical protein
VAGTTSFFLQSALHYSVKTQPPPPPPHPSLRSQDRGPHNRATSSIPHRGSRFKTRNIVYMPQSAEADQGGMGRLSSRPGELRPVVSDRQENAINPSLSARLGPPPNHQGAKDFQFSFAIKTEPLSPIPYSSFGAGRSRLRGSATHSSGQASRTRDSASAVGQARRTVIA